MSSFKAIVLIAAALAAGAESSGVAVPTAVAAPLVTPAHFGYAHAVPHNIPPYAAQINVASKAFLAPAPFAAPVAAPFAAPVAAPFTAPLAAPFTAPVAAPFTAPVAAPFAAPVAAPVPAPVPAPFAAPLLASAPFARVASPFYSGAPVLPGPYPYQTPIDPAGYAGAYPYAAPFFRAPVGVPAFVR